jgi:hypothetical protein
VREVALKDKDARFTELLHHVTPELLERSFRSLKKDAAPGADGVRWREYKRGAPVRLVFLWERAQQGKYRARCRARPAAGRHEVLNAVYEADFPRPCPARIPQHPPDSARSGQRAETRQTRTRPPARIQEPLARHPV